MSRNAVILISFLIQPPRTSYHDLMFSAIGSIPAKDVREPGDTKCIPVFLRFYGGVQRFGKF